MYYIIYSLVFQIYCDFSKCILTHSIFAYSPATMVAVTKGGIAHETEILCGTEAAGMAAYH